jgi:ABC-type transporter Mla MlaB component
MLRIETWTETPSTVTYALNGRVTEEHLPELGRLLSAARAEGRQVTLDLAGVVLVDRGFVRFLSAGEGARAELAHCPAYVRSWMRCEGCEGDEEKSQ